IVSGLVNPEKAILETWVVLKSSITAGTTGNVQTSIGPAQTCTNAGCTTGSSINVGNQTVPLLSAQEFFSKDADVSVTKSDNPDPVYVGNQLTYTITVKNNSSHNTANGIVVTDTLDPNTTFVSSSLGGACSVVGQVVTCNIGGLVTGQSRSFTITVNVANTAPTAGTVQTGACTVGQSGVDLCNTVSVDAINDDPNTGNNSDTEPTNVLPLATLQIIKNTVGGNDTFNYSAAGTGLPSSFSITTAGGTGSQTFNNLIPGVKTINELALPSGWSFTSLTCTDPDGGTTASGQTANIDLDPGEIVVCTYTNTIQRATLIVKKILPNDNGGTKTYTDFSFQVNGGSATAFESDGQNDLTVSPGTYTVVETTVAGYTTTYSNCSGVVIPPGGSATCTITNNDNASTLKLVKTVTKDDGGTAVADDWTLYAAATDLGFTDRNFDNLGGSGIFETVYANHGYDLSESVVTGYTAGSWSCDGGTLVGSTITLALGDDVTCTINNDDVAPKLIIIKHVINDNGGPYVASDWKLDSGGNNDSPDDFTGSETGTTVTLDAGNYNVTESGPVGYAELYSADCAGTIAVGETRTCTVTNDDQPSNLILTKTADADHVPAGQQIGFTITVHNVGPGTAYNASLSDPLPTGENINWSIDAAVPGCSIVDNVLTCNLGNLVSGTTVTVHVVSPTTTSTCELFSNTATLSSTANPPISATASTASYCDLKVTKTATPTFKRWFTWSIDKSVNKTLVKQVGGSSTFNYVVTVKQTGFTDKSWKVTGKITIVNPNPTLDVTGVNVTDVVNNGGSCTVVDGSGITIPAGGSTVLDYTCTYASAPTSYIGKNEAIATWPAEIGTPNTSEHGYASFTFDGGVSSIDRKVTIWDRFNGSTTTLGTVYGTMSMPYTVKTFTYPRTVTMPASGCKSYKNIAKILETGQYASKTITVCGPINLGAKSKGFWQSKNGQNIIKQTASAGGVCKLTSWLKAYAPFKNLSATASCATAATYVYNTIKAADSSGASMNAMLKAQMLATALDVYYSNPALGGNKIGAPAPIGNVTVDLTWVKTGSGYKNVSGAFGGATSKTISQMLSYAAGQSNAGGSIWYGNVKTMQEKAKNAFDAINNNWMFAP
ncbi:MAG: hypothetical protein Q7T89_13980, partial [Anaerolineales bacterium]|nr:hypothetical protein [Anaerolineales bacterium]